MVSINLYQPDKLDITIDFPTTWNELTQAEVIFIAKCLWEQNDEETAMQTRPLILKFLLESRAKHPQLQKNWFFSIDTDQAVIDGFPLLDFIFLTNDLTNLPATLFFGKEEFFPVLFSKLTCGEYEDCEMQANKFAEEASLESLAHLAAILFRQKKNGEAVSYMQYNQRTNSYYTYQADQKIPKFLKLLPEELYAIFIWYAGSRNQLPLMFPNLYDGPKGEPDMAVFTKCIHSGAGPKNGTRIQIRVMELYEFLFDMDQEALKAKELAEEYEKMKNQP